MTFSRTSIGNIDLNLLSSLIVLVEERSTIAAAKRLHLAQSTVAGTLGKLREVFADELLVKNGRVLEPTTQALELVRIVKPHLEGLAAAVGSIIDFDPAQDHREFRIGCTDGVAFSLMPRLIAELREKAPHCDLVIRVGDYRTLPTMLSSGEITVALGYLRDDLSATFKIRSILSSPWLILRDAAQPVVSDIDSFCNRPHAIVTPDGNLDGFVDDQLKILGRSRRVVIGLSNFSLLLVTLPGRDLIATVPDFVAKSLCAIGGLAIDSCPVEVPPVSNRLVWRPVADRDASQRWLRQQLGSSFVQCSA